MREALVFLFKEKFKMDLFIDAIPENHKTFPVACYAVNETIKEEELDGSLSLHEVLFDVDILCRDINELALLSQLLLDLSGKMSHRYKDHFQLMRLRSAMDAGSYDGLKTSSGNPPQILQTQISLYE